MTVDQDLTYWIWLQLGLGCGSAASSRVAAQYGDPADFYKGGEREWRLSGLLTPRQIAKLSATGLEEAQTVAARCAKRGYRMLSLGSPGYPDRLRQIARPPVLLYVRGELGDLNRTACVAMVGTRSATPYGMQMARYFAGELAKAGVIVVSGGALGIDSASHLGALEAGGRTIAVLGCGFEDRYLAQNEPLRARIAGQGALVSEYPPDAPAAPGNFPMRNRIIAGLSLGVLVVEAGVKSGSLITAQAALDEGRDVFAVPGNLNSAQSGGTNALLRTGAKPAVVPADILEEYCRNFPDTLTLTKPAAMPEQQTPEGGAASRVTGRADLDGLLSPAGKRLLAVLAAEPVPVDELAAKAGLTARETLMAATELELLGAAAARPGKRYALL